VHGGQFYLIPRSDVKQYRRKGKHHEVVRRSIFEHDRAEQTTWEETTAGGRALRITLHRFDNLMLRSKKGFNMKDKPFDLPAVQAWDARDGKPVFQRPMYLGLWNERKGAIAAQGGYQAYRRRYDIEPFNAFAKRRLLLQAFQTCVRQHLENWLLVIMLAMSLLYVASTEVMPECHKWERCTRQHRQARNRPRQLSMFNTCKAAYSLFSTFEQRPFLPQKPKKPPGRQKGDTQDPRPRYLPMFKKKAKSKQKPQPQPP
jgi:hypothetical protein